MSTGLLLDVIHFVDAGDERPAVAQQDKAVLLVHAVCMGSSQPTFITCLNHLGKNKWAASPGRG